MSFKQYVPDTSEDWDTYWSQTTIDRELKIVKTDGLNPIFKKYLKKDGINIEAGCGLGKWVVSLAKSKYNIIGLDTYVKGLHQLKSYDKNLELMASDVAEMGLKDNSIDAYISLGVVEHFEEGPQKPLAEAYRTVKPGELAFIEVPYDSPVRRLMRLFNKIKVTVKLPAKILVEGLGLRPKRELPKMKFYEYRYTTDELKGFVTEAGFEIVELLPKDDLAANRSIMLWSDFPSLRHSNGNIFELNENGVKFKKFLDAITPFTYSALIVAVCRKPKH